MCVFFERIALAVFIISGSALSQTSVIPAAGTGAAGYPGHGGPAAGVQLAFPVGVRATAFPDDGTPGGSSVELDNAPTRPGSGMRLWRASVATLAATYVMDVKSSWGKDELNPALAGNGGTFGVKGALLKAGITGGVIALEALVLRHGPSKGLSRALAVLNFESAAAIGAMAARNWGVPGR